MAEAKVNKCLIVAICDLQQVLLTPHSDSTGNVHTITQLFVKMEHRRMCVINEEDVMEERDVLK